MNRFNYPFTRILTKSHRIENIYNLDLQDVASLMSADKNLHRVKTLTHFYPESEGKPIYRNGEKMWFVLEEVTLNEINVTSIVKDTSLYAIWTFIVFMVLTNLFFPSFRRFGIITGVFFGLAGLGLVFLAQKNDDAQVRAKVNEIAAAINQVT